MERNVSPANLVDRKLEYYAKNVSINLDYGTMKLGKLVFLLSTFYHLCIET